MTENKFKSQFVEWAKNDYQLPIKKIEALKRIIDTQFWKELESRDIHKKIILRPLSNSQNLEISYSSDVKMVYQNEENELVIGTIIPTWKHGWRFVDDDVRDLLQFFLHFAEQYVARSRALNATGGIALTYGKACDFRYKGFYSTLIERFDFNDLNDPQYNKKETKESFDLKSEFNHWQSTLNCLDPLIHRIIYQFWKGSKLYDQGDFEDSVTSFASSIAVISEYCQNRLNQKSGSRLEKIEVLDIKTDSIDYLRDLEKLRNRFSAHPSHTKWWDFAELFGDQLRLIINVIKDIIEKLCEHESKNRVIENDPQKWSSWLRNNSMVVFDSVWFHKLPPLKGEY